MLDSCRTVEVTNGPAVVLSPDEASDIVAGQSLTCATRATASSATAATAKRTPTIAPIRDSCATTYEEIPLESPTDSSSSSLLTSSSSSVTTTSSAETTDTDTAPPSPLLEAAEAIDGDPAAADLAATTSTANTCTTPDSSSSIALAFALRNLAQHQLRYSGGSGHTSPTRGSQLAASKSKSPPRSRPTFRRIPVKVAMSEKEVEEVKNGESTPVEESVVSIISPCADVALFKSTAGYMLRWNSRPPTRNHQRLRRGLSPSSKISLAMTLIKTPQQKPRMVQQSLPKLL